MLAMEVPARVHQLNGIQRRLPAPRRCSGMRALTMKVVLDRDQAGHASVTPRGSKRIVDVGEQNSINILEVSSPHIIGLRAEQLLGDAGPNPDGSMKTVLDHQVLHGKRGEYVEWLTGVVTF